MCAHGDLFPIHIRLCNLKTALECDIQLHLKKLFIFWSNQGWNLYQNEILDYFPKTWYN